MKLCRVAGIICAIVVLVSGKTFYISGPHNIKDCKFSGYVPGGNVVDVSKIIAPVAQLAKNAAGSIIGPVSKATTLAKKSLKFIAKISTAFAKVSPFLGPALGVFGAATGIFKSMTEPKPEDILNAANTAIADLAKDMNDKLDDMKGYVDGQIIKTEKELIKREYRTKFNLLVHCVTEPTKDLSTECQRDTYKDIGSSFPDFAIFDTQLIGSKPSPLTTMQVKELEAYLVPFRNYAVLLMLSLVPLIKLYKEDKTDIGRGYYKKYSTELKNKAEKFIKYSNAAVAAIVKMHQGPDGAGACSNSFECGTIHEIREGWHMFKKHTADWSECTCVIDDGTKQRCSIRGTIRVDGHKTYIPYNFAVRSTTDALRRWAKRTLVERAAKPFVNVAIKFIKTYWQKELLDFIPEWKKAIVLAEPGARAKFRVSTLSHSFSPRYKQRLQFARALPTKVHPPLSMLESSLQFIKEYIFGKFHLFKIWLGA